MQILRWHNEEFDLYEEGALRIKPVDILLDQDNSKLHGCVQMGTDKLELVLVTRGVTRSSMIETLIHEAAHVLLWDVGRGVTHGDEYWKLFGRMMDAYDHHGREDSKSYFVD